MKPLPDPVLEAECCLFLCKIALLKNDRSGYQSYIRQWLTLKQFVDNCYLAYLETALYQELDSQGPRFERTFDEMCDPHTKLPMHTIGWYLDEYEAWLKETIRVRYNVKTKVEWAKFYGNNPTNIDRKKPTRR